MPAIIMDTRSIAANLRQHLRQDVISFNRQYNQTPGLVILGVCEDQSTIDIMRIVGRNAVQLGIRYSAQLLPNNAKAKDMRRIIEQLNDDPNVHGISLQLPLPKHLDVDEIGSYIKLEKDVEGLNPAHFGKAHMGKPFLVAPPALSTLKLLSMYGINPSGRHAVIVGRNMMIGRPLASLLTKFDATVTLCHSLTNNLKVHTSQAEILVSAAGVPGLIKADMVRRGAIVIDYGMNYMGKAQVVGDVAFQQVVEVASAITPMPGGTGPLTIICLVENLLKAARFQLNTEPVVAKSFSELDQSFTFHPNVQKHEINSAPELLAPRPDLLINQPNPKVTSNSIYR